MLNALLRKGGIDVNLADSNKDTPLHLVFKKDNIDINVLNALLGAKDINVNAKDNSGWTPLHFAARNNNKEIVDALIKAKANVNIKDEDGRTPFDFSINEEIKALLTNAQNPDDGSVGGLSTSQTEEQPSSFFGSLFSILMKPFSLIASFFGGFFSWLFGSDEPIQSSSESDQPVVLEPPNSSGDHDII